MKAEITKTKFNFAKPSKEEEAQNKLRGSDQASSISRKLADTEGVDWTAKGLLGPIRNQGLCGACWAFSAVGSIESAMAIAKYNKMTPSQQGEEWDLADVDTNGRVTEELGLVIPLSEQNLIDCDVMNQQGCDGGL